MEREREDKQLVSEQVEARSWLGLSLDYLFRTYKTPTGFSLEVTTVMPGLYWDGSVLIVSQPPAYPWPDVKEEVQGGVVAKGEKHQVENKSQGSSQGLTRGQVLRLWENGGGCWPLGDIPQGPPDR